MKRELTLPIIISFLYAASVLLNASFGQQLLQAAARQDVVERAFGSLRVFVGDWAFMKAEEYHHRGLPFEDALAYHKGESLFAGREHHEEGAEAHKRSQRNASLYPKLYSQVKITADSHLKPEEEKEVLPWFYVEVAFNPHDIRGYVLGAYWLERVREKGESLKFLQQGEKNNPDSAQILSAIGELYSKEGNYEEATTLLEHACRLWLEDKGVNAVTNSYEESDRLFAFDLLASLYVRQGDHDKALDIYRELLKFGPNPAILEKVSKIKNLKDSL